MLGLICLEHDLSTEIPEKWPVKTFTPTAPTSLFHVYNWILRKYLSYSIIYLYKETHKTYSFYYPTLQLLNYSHQTSISEQQKDLGRKKMVAIKKNSTFQIIIIIIISILGYEGLRLLTISQIVFAYLQTHFFFPSNSLENQSSTDTYNKPTETGSDFSNQKWLMCLYKIAINNHSY